MTAGDRGFAALLAAAAVGLVAARLPALLALKGYAFSDAGATLTLDRLVADGQRPGVDFVYLYGLLPIAVGRAWFAVWGATPYAFAAGTLLALAATIAGLAAAARNLALGWPARLVILAALPLMVPDRYLSLTHALEPALLVWALACQTGGRLRTALVLATVAVTVKPSMGYVLGFVLVVQILTRAWWGGGWRAAVRDFAPAAVAGAALVGGLAAFFGPTAVTETLWPAKAAVVYKAEGFGFFNGQGRSFWNPPGANIRYYLGSPVGYWLVATAVVTGAAVGALVVRSRGPRTTALFTATVLHWVFVTAAFGHEVSWQYYLYVLVIGVAAAVGLLPRRVRWPAAAALAALALMGNYAHVRGATLASWRTDRWTADGLFADPALTAEWDRLRAGAADRPTFVLYHLGGAPSVAPEFDAPRSWCLYPYLATPGEREQVLAGIRRASVVAVPRHDDCYLAPTHPYQWPAVRDELRQFRKVETWTHFIVYTREG